MSTNFLPFILNFGIIGLQVVRCLKVYRDKFRAVFFFFFSVGGTQEYYYKDG